MISYCATIIKPVGSILLVLTDVRTRRYLMTPLQLYQLPRTELSKLGRHILMAKMHPSMNLLL